eukprot:Opistho-2@90644
MRLSRVAVVLLAAAAVAFALAEAKIAPRNKRMTTHDTIVAHTPRAHQNVRPIVGMLLQPTTQEQVFAPFGNSYLPASYVKWVESAGARVVPIPFNATDDELIYLFNGINGLLWPGGNTDVDAASVYQQRSKFLYDLAVKANAVGDFFPIWGTCLGFEQLSLITSGDEAILGDFDADNATWPLHFTPEAAASRMFGAATPSVIAAFEREAICENLHEHGVVPEKYATNANLASTYRVLAVNRDRNGQPFVSAIEGIALPFYATQFHPERNAFEWDPEEPIKHSASAVVAMQHIANFFCRRNAEESALLWQ